MDNLFWYRVPKKNNVINGGKNVCRSTMFDKGNPSLLSIYKIIPLRCNYLLTGVNKFNKWAIVEAKNRQNAKEDKILDVDINANYICF